jgi:peptidoglycan hydrolase CwlO-like protein
MKRTLFIVASLATLITNSIGEPVKWADGNVTEAFSCKLQPSSVELTTANGIENVELGKLDPEWLKSKFPGEEVLSLRAALKQSTLQLSKMSEQLYGASEGARILFKRISELESRTKELEEENTKLKAELKKTKKVGTR